jgi:hypothetical protein
LLEKRDEGKKFEIQKEPTRQKSSSPLPSMDSTEQEEWHEDAKEEKKVMRLLKISLRVEGTQSWMM